MLVMSISSIRLFVWNALDPINAANRDRGFGSWTEEEAYRNLRFHKRDLPLLLERLGFPNVFVLPSGTTCSGEYAMCVMFYRLHYPSTLAMLQSVFGRDYSQISRIFYASVDLVYTAHSGKVNGNIAWYRDRFGLYNDAIVQKIGELPVNPNPGQCPVVLNNIFAFIDCTANKICRPSVSIRIFVYFNMIYSRSLTYVYSMSNCLYFDKIEY